jgi:hypothetical protein
MLESTEELKTLGKLPVRIQGKQETMKWDLPNGHSCPM